MDGARFDRLTRALAVIGPSRRRLVAGALAAVGLGGGMRTVEAACPPGQVSRRGVGCICRRTGRPPVNGVCPCPDGRPPCGDVCCAAGEVCDDFFGCKVDGVALNAPASAVWAALVDAEALAAWAVPNDIAPHVGHRFHLLTVSPDGEERRVAAEIVAIEPERRLAFAWSAGRLERPATVTVTLAPIDDGRRTRLRLTHDGGPEVCRVAAALLGRDWQRRLLADALPRHLSGGAPYREIDSARSSP
jgi:uncharacterized protein YndB with AHSA1/START domain